MLLFLVCLLGLPRVGRKSLSSVWLWLHGIDGGFGFFDLRLLSASGCSEQCLLLWFSKPASSAFVLADQVSFLFIILVLGRETSLLSLPALAVITAL